MPEDIRINWDVGLMEGDISFNTTKQDLEKDSGLETAVIISLFTDRRARDDDVLPDSNNPDRRGWWGDLGSPIVKGDQIGSRLWLLNREKTLESVLARAQEYAKEALQWLIDDEVAVKVDVSVERSGSIGNDRLALLAQIYKKDGNNETFKYELQWSAQSLR
jgi:phage gp46-like protein